MITGVDLSKYNGANAMDGYSFVIENVDDPNIADKINYAKDRGIPWGTYKWVYPGANLTTDAINAVNATRGFGEPPMGIWWDYEETGVSQDQLVDAFRAADSMGMKSGYYTNVWRVDHAALKNAVGDRPLWVAGYPGANDGSFPGFGSIPNQDPNSGGWPAKLWQYTSTNGSLDVNAVVDEGWYGSWVGSAAPKEDDDVANMYITKQTDPNQGIWVTDGLTKRWVGPDEWSFAQFVTGGKATAVPISDQWWDSLPTLRPDTVLDLKDLANIGNVVKANVPASGGAAPVDLTAVKDAAAQVADAATKLSSALSNL